MFGGKCLCFRRARIEEAGRRFKSGGVKKFLGSSPGSLHDAQVFSLLATDTARGKELMAVFLNCKSSSRHFIAAEGGGRERKKFASTKSYVSNSKSHVCVSMVSILPSRSVKKRRRAHTQNSNCFCRRERRVLQQKPVPFSFFQLGQKLTTTTQTQ